MPSPQKIVFVTGCTEGGIGAAVCREYAEHGARVFAGVRKVEALGALASIDKITPVVVDVTDDASVQGAVEEIFEAAGQIDVLVNNAGVNMAAGPAIDVALDQYQKTFDVNVSGRCATRPDQRPYVYADVAHSHSTLA